MRERIIDNWGSESLLVFPFLADDLPDAFMASAGRVEAIRYWNDEGKAVWGVKINASFSLPSSREDTDKLKAAIDRCWQWIDEQDSAAVAQEDKA